MIYSLGFAPLRLLVLPAQSAKPARFAAEGWAAKWRAV
jgi:hypothetical protein